VSDAADFVRRFEAFWADPVPSKLDTVLAPRARLVAPLTKTLHTREEGIKAFADLFELIRGMRVEIHRWSATEDGVLIEFTARGTAGGKPISWDAVDRFVVGSDGLATERVSYFDSAPLALAIGLRPRAWPAFVRSRLGS
jgi:ketosteroid isomerase-like protein